MTTALIAPAPSVAAAEPAGTTPGPVGRLVPAPVRVLLAAARLVVLLPVLLAALVRHRRSGADSASLVGPADVLFAGPGELDLTVVIPSYNPGAALRSTVTDLVAAADRAGIAYEVIAVSDGSTDGSDEGLEEVGPAVRVVRCATNRGKGAALHTGFARARGRYVGFVDADGDIDPAHVVDYLAVARSGDHDVVYASKRHPLSQSASSAVRKVISYGFISVVGTLFALGVADTQTGCKLFRRETLATVLPRLREHRFAFDLEFFVAARAAGVARMVAAPVEIKARMAGSTVGRAAITRTLGDALTVLARLHFTPTYRTAVPLVPTPQRPSPDGGAVVPLPRRSPEATLPAPTTATLAKAA